MNKLTHAIALRKQEKYRKSSQLLLEIWEDLSQHEKAIRFYADKSDQVWT
ncbi:hypothetical protein [Ornithinibacillus hominis]|uniref:Uncharacterized protein n=1 Tax=Ornithinibacillus hominis TaxID=2763055 RepID=A0A923L2N9_9BACI|nr:hypothetical protein [Ornithinibacillus hominis]MBC5635373.1 hypothetical protein [Ornithinibacillus hominis]